MKALFHILALMIVCCTSSFAFSPTITAPNNIEFSNEWQEYITIDGVLIEYKMKTCIIRSNREEQLLLFRYSNTTNSAKTISWKTKIWRNDACANCHKIDRPEYSHSITLDANEVIEADGTSKENKALYIFGNYVKHVQGMSDQRLTSFELVELTSI